MKDFFQYRESLTEATGLSAADKKKIAEWGVISTEALEYNWMHFIKLAKLTPAILEKAVAKHFKSYWKNDKKMQEKLSSATLNFKNPKKYPSSVPLKLKWSGDIELDREIDGVIEDVLLSGQKEIARGEYGVYTIGKYYHFVTIEDEGNPPTGFVDKEDRLPRGKIKDAILHWEKWYTEE